MQKTTLDIPNGIGKDALTGYIHTATLCTVDLETYKHFYGEVMKMNLDFVELTDEAKKSQRKFWNIPDNIDYDLYHCYRPTVPSLIQLRILHLKSPTPHIHNSYSSYELGSFSLGFPTSDAKAMDKRVQGDYGVKAMAPMQLGDIVRANGDKGHYLETIYQGPDYLHCVGIERVNYPQLAPCDPVDGFGGPGYSAFVAKDSDAEVAFYTNVLEHYILFDSVWEAAEDGALGVNPGTPFRFCGIYAPEAQQNHFLLLDFKDGNMIDTGVQSCIPNQGLGMYTFQTRDIEKVMRNAQQHGIKVLSAIQRVSDYILGDGKACLLETPNGLYVEIFEQN